MEIWYNVWMKKHWSVDEEKLKGTGDQYEIWKLEERINHGIGKAKIDKKSLLKFWAQIFIDPWKRKALASALNIAV